MSEVHTEIDAIVSRGFSRDQAVKIFFGNHPEQKYDPSASYNFDKGNGGLSLSNPSSVRTNADPNNPGSYANNTTPKYQNTNENNQWTLPGQLGYNGADSNRYEEEHIQNLMSKGLSRQEAEDAHFNRKKGAASVRRPSDTAKLSSFVVSQQQSSNSAKSESIKIQTTTTTVVSSEIDDNLSLSPEDSAPIHARANLLNRKASMQPSFSAADEAEIQLLIGQGYPRMVAVQMYVQKGRLGGLTDVVIESNNNSAKLSTANSLSYSRSQTPTPSGERVITAADFGDTRGYNVSTSNAQSSSPAVVREPSMSPVVRSQQWSAPSQNQSPVPRRTNSGGQEALSAHSPVPLGRHGSIYDNNSNNNNSHNSHNSHRDYSAQPQSAPSHPSLPRRPSAVITVQEEDLPTPLSSTNAARQRQRRPSATSTTMIGSDNRDNWETQSTHSFQSTTSRSVLLVPERLPPAHTTLARGNSNNSGANDATPRTTASLSSTYPPRSAGSTGSRAGSVSGDSVSQIEDDAQYYDRLMSRGYTEEQAELAVQQRALQAVQPTVTPLKQSVLKRAGESTNSMTSGGSLSRHSSAGNAVFDAAANNQQQQHFQQQINNHNYQTDNSYQQQEYNVRSGGSVSSQQSNNYQHHNQQHQQPVDNNYQRQDQQQQNNSQYSNNSQHNNNNSNNDFSFMRQESGGSYQTASSGEEQETFEPAPRSAASEMSTFSTDEQYAFGEWLCKGYSEQQSVDMVLQERTRNMEAIAQALSEMDQPQQQQPRRRLESNQSIISGVTSTAGSRHQSNYSLNSRQDVPSLSFSQQPQRLSSQQQMYTSPDQFSPPVTARSAVPLSADDEALRVAMLISEQESEFGENMYERLSAADDEEIRLLVEQGYTPDDAVLVIFQRTHRSRNPNVYIPVPTAPQRRPSFANSPPLPPQQQYALQYPPQQQQYQEQQGHQLHSTMSFPQSLPQERFQQQHHLHHSQSFQQPSHNQQLGQHYQHQPQYQHQQTYQQSQPQMDFQQQQYAPPPLGAYPSAYPSSRSRAGSISNSQAGSRNGSRGHSRPSSRAGSPSRDREREKDAYGNRLDASSPHTQSTGGIFSSFFGGSRSSSGNTHAHNQHQRDEYSSQQQGGGSSHASSSYHAAETKAELAMRKKLHYKESDVRVLVDMGYSKEQAVQALVENNNNVGLAAEMLARS